jgi:hypothetical protein
LRSSRSIYPKVQVTSKEEEMSNSDRSTTLDRLGTHTAEGAALEAFQLPG